MAVCNRFWTVNDMYKSGDSDIYTVMSRVHLLNCYSQSTGLKLEISTSPLILRAFPRLLRSSLYCHFHSLSCTFSLRLLVATIKKTDTKEEANKSSIKRNFESEKKKNPRRVNRDIFTKVLRLSVLLQANRYVGNLYLTSLQSAYYKRQFSRSNRCLQPISYVRRHGAFSYLYFLAVIIVKYYMDQYSSIPSTSD